MLKALLDLSNGLFSFVFGRLGAEASGTDNHSGGVSTVQAGTSKCDGSREGGVPHPIAGGCVAAA